MPTRKSSHAWVEFYSDLRFKYFQSFKHDSYQTMHKTIMYAFVYHIVNHMYCLSYGLLAHHWCLDNNVNLTFT